MKRSLFLSAAVFAALTCAVSCISLKSTMGKRIGHVFAVAGEHALRTAARFTPGEYPTNTVPGGAWETTGIYGWTSGFFPGSLWYLYERTGDEKWKDLAVPWTEGLEDVKNYTKNHDVGFMIYCSYGNGYRLTNNPAYRDVMLTAASSLATRFNENTGCLQSWGASERWTFPVIVDNMMNLELLFWAAKNGGPSSLYDIAERHALTTIRTHVREDGSTFHVVDFDPATGIVRGKYTHQGYAKDSCWSRGHAWGIYGFTVAYRETKRPEFLATANKLAAYFIEHLPEDGVPYWDFNAPKIPDEPRDSSAAAIAASGLLELSTLVTDTVLAEKYHATALRILQSLSSPAYLDKDGSSMGLLLHGVSSLPHGRAIDQSLIYGDYYFLEALLRLRAMM